jgi:polyisoprenoid-binding protein YceI
MRFLATLTLATLLTPLWASAAPVRQELSKSSSRITFGVQSPNPTLAMNGSFKDFDGVFELHPSEITDSKLELTLNLGSATLPPDQLMQALFVQGIIARVAPTPNTFRSSRFEHKAGNSYLLHGTYTWMNKLKKIAVPVTISEASPSRTRIQLALEGSFSQREAPRNVEGLAASAAGSEGWTKATLVFTP